MSEESVVFVAVSEIELGQGGVPAGKLELPNLDSSLRIYEAAIKAGDCELLECASKALQCHLMIQVVCKASGKL